MVNIKKLSAVIVFSVGLSFCFGQCAKYEPADNTALLIMGQDLGANGGFSSPDNAGYHEQVNTETPAGVTTYTSIPSLNGLFNYDNYGAGNVCAECIVNSPNYNNSSLVIGLYMVNQLNATANGTYDNKIDELGNWIKATGRPVFLRIGYEFEYQYGSENPQSFISAYKRIVDRFELLGVANCAFVWQAAAGVDPWSHLSQWYPGDNYVDWFGYSHFAYNGSTMIAIARSKGKPVMIAEATPINWRLHEADGNFAWNSWFQPMFDHIEENKDVIKALAYINQNWDIQPLWQGQNWGNSRVQDNPVVLQKWIDEISKPFWIKASPTLFNSLDNCGEVIAFNDWGTKHPITISPNPATDVLLIQSNQLDTHITKVTLLSPTGELTPVNPQYPHSTTTTIDLSDLNPGMYIIRIETNTGSLTQKVLKQ